jgi:ABC-2 type transport system ATP-binding protein
MGFLKPTAGRAIIDEVDCYRQSVEVHRRVSYLPGDARLFRHLNGRETLELFSRLRPAASIERSLKLAGRLQLDLSRRVRQMSTGMRQKLALAVALTPDVPLVILDEPTANLDPTVRRDVIDLIREARTAGKTILFSSHVLSEVEETCDRVLVLRSGQLVDSVRVADVRRQHQIRAELTGPLTLTPPALAASLEITQPSGGEVIILTRGDLAPLLGWLAQQPLARLEIEPVGLRTVYERHHPASAP